MSAAATAVDLASRGVAAPVPGPRAATARAAVRAGLAACDGALAAWEAGSAAFGRADELSDLDVGVLCAPGRGEDVLDAIEAAVRTAHADLDVWAVGRSMFGVQRFWQPRSSLDDAPICMVDASVIEHGEQTEEWRELLRPERHGRALTLHDPTGLLEAAKRSATFDAAAHREELTRQLERIRARHALFASFPAKEGERGRPIDASAFHHSMLVLPLVQLLGMVHRPLRWDFGMRYLHDELPEDVVECLVPIAAGGAADDARTWIDDLLERLDPAALPIEEHAAQMRAAFG